MRQKVNERKYAAVTQKSFDITDGGRKGQLPVHLHQFSVQQLVEQTSCLLGQPPSWADIDPETQARQGNWRMGYKRDQRKSF